MKVPFIDLYIFRGLPRRLRELQEITRLRLKINARLKKENMALKRRLARWEGDSKR
jgi:hypothetical protein